MRVIKEYDERKKEILDTAERLFRIKGYDKCTIMDIIKEVGIAKGTFYHYFKSKEEVLDAIVLRYVDIVRNNAEEILLIENINPVEKLMRAFMAMQVTNQIDKDLLDNMHRVENALLHQKALNQLVTTMTPILVKVIEEGIEEKVWSCKYPLEYMQIFLVASLTLTDEGIFELDSDSQMSVMAAMISMLEKMLNVPEDCFMKLFIENFGKM
ncbi:TetR/AcrR family transcriptional regulator [Alkaliphilus oremlandii]|uniref:Transcriptional regulator, TetR family n=1 Tax=Alkaliphilus oremlandii (strain OhILAs) TaxID=350688 RepID=A8MEH5_ALKOO|nr:TetR/AcrR family transcriptional regulator [Alkaliphilus oremlandii]ABW18304.1 transcriptional regulator, TetR family [Alkaliphilus oremlandii OhILAs]